MYFDKFEWLLTLMNILLIVLLGHHVYKAIWSPFVSEVLLLCKQDIEAVAFI